MPISTYHLTLDVLTEDLQCIVLVVCGALNCKMARLSQARTAAGQQNTEAQPPCDVSSNSCCTVDIKRIP
jgi:hypothetical protein